MGCHNISGKKNRESPNFLAYVRHSFCQHVRVQTNWKKLDCFAVIQSSKDQEILDNVFKNCTKTFTQTSCRRVDMGANVEIFSLNENPEGKGCFHWYQISGNLKIFGCSSANAAIEVVLLFEINSSINRKKNYVNNSWSANAGLLEEVGLLRSCSVHYTHQQKKTHTSAIPTRNRHTAVRGQSYKKWSVYFLWNDLLKWVYSGCPTLGNAFWLNSEVDGSFNALFEINQRYGHCF